MLTKALFFGAQVFRAACAHHAHTYHDNVAVFSLGAREHPLQSYGISSVAHGHHHAARTNGYRFPADGVLVLQLKMVLDLARRQGMSTEILAFRDAQNDEEYSRKNDAAHSSDRLRKQVDDGCRSQHEKDGEQTDRQLEFSDSNIWRNLPAAFAVVFPSQDEHCQAVECERPNDAEGIRLAQGDDIAPGHDDREHLQTEDQVDDTGTGAELGMRLAEPVRQHA